MPRQRPSGVIQGVLCTARLPAWSIARRVAGTNSGQVATSVTVTRRARRRAWAQAVPSGDGRPGDAVVLAGPAAGAFRAQDPSLRPVRPAAPVVDTPVPDIVSHPGGGIEVDRLRHTDISQEYPHATLMRPAELVRRPHLVVVLHHTPLPPQPRGPRLSAPAPTMTHQRRPAQAKRRSPRQRGTPL